MLFEKKYVEKLRIASAMWLKANPDHYMAEGVGEAIAGTNIPSMGRPRVSEALRVKVIEMMRRVGPKPKYSPVSRRLGISPPTVKRIWDEHLIAEALRIAESKKKSP